MLLAEAGPGPFMAIWPAEAKGYREEEAEGGSDMRLEARPALGYISTMPLLVEVVEGGRASGWEVGGRDEASISVGV